MAKEKSLAHRAGARPSGHLAHIFSRLVWRLRPAANHQRLCKGLFYPRRDQCSPPPVGKIVILPQVLARDLSSDLLKFRVGPIVDGSDYVEISARYETSMCGACAVQNHVRLNSVVPLSDWFD